MPRVLAAGEVEALTKTRMPLRMITTKSAPAMATPRARAVEGEDLVLTRTNLLSLITKSILITMLILDITLNIRTMVLKGNHTLNLAVLGGPDIPARMRRLTILTPKRSTISLTRLTIKRKSTSLLIKN
jgi:hypothetical protein